MRHNPIAGHPPARIVPLGAEENRPAGQEEEAFKGQHAGAPSAAAARSDGHLTLAQKAAACTLALCCAGERTAAVERREELLRVLLHADLDLRDKAGPPQPLLLEDLVGPSVGWQVFILQDGMRYGRGDRLELARCDESLHFRVVRALPHG